MNENQILEEMQLLRQECRELNAEIVDLLGKTTRRTQKLKNLKEQNRSDNITLDKLSKEVASFKPYDCNDLEKEIEDLETKISESSAEYEQIVADVDRLSTALRVQNESKLKQEIYGQVRGGSLQYVNKGKSENYAIALRRILEDELYELQQTDVAPRLVARKRAQVTRAQILCP